MTKPRINPKTKRALTVHALDWTKTAAACDIRISIDRFPYSHSKNPKEVTCKRCLQWIAR